MDQATIEIVAVYRRSISDDFRNMDLWERMRLLGRARVGIKAPMEILGCTEEEITSEPPGTFMGNEVIAKGVEIVA